MNRDLGEQNLTLLEQGKKAAAKEALDHLESGDKEIQIEATTDGAVEADVNVPITAGPTWLKGGLFTTFVQTNVKKLKDTVGGFRISKKF